MSAMTYEETLAKIKEIATDVKGRFDALNTKYEMLKAEMQRPGAPGRKTMDYAFPDFTTPGARFAQQADADLLKKTNRLRFECKDGFHPRFEQKTLIDSAALGFSTPGILNAERIEGIVPLPRRRLTVRDLLRAKPITAGQIDWINETLFTNAASPQVEGNAKAESGNTFQIASEKVRTLAHWLPVTKQALDDLPELGRWIDENLIYGLKILEEHELLFGDGTGEHLNGICTQATAYAGTYVVPGDTKLDKLRHAILELEDAGEECTAFILNPRDVHDIDLIKTTDGGANTGHYVVGNPLGGLLKVRTYWGRPVVTTNAMTSGKFLAGNFANAIIGDRQAATIDVSDSHADFFVANKIAVRCEERISLAVLRAGSFRFGSL